MESSAHQHEPYLHFVGAYSGLIPQSFESRDL